mgnify:CR=1 FL=1
MERSPNAPTCRAGPCRPPAGNGAVPRVADRPAGAAVGPLQVWSGPTRHQPPASHRSRPPAGIERSYQLRLAGEIGSRPLQVWSGPGIRCVGERGSAPCRYGGAVPDAPAAWERTSVGPCRYGAVPLDEAAMPRGRRPPASTERSASLTTQRSPESRTQCRPRWVTERSCPLTRPCESPCLDGAGGWSRRRLRVLRRGGGWRGSRRWLCRGPSRFRSRVVVSG